jgi:ribosome recycling factor
MPLEIKLIENDETSFQKPMEQHMEGPLKHFETELLKIRTGRAHTSLVEDLLVVCYAQPPAPLKNYAALAAPEARLITIQPWDKTVLADIEKAITSSDLGLTPRNDGNIIRIQLPEISGDRRDQLVKSLHKKLEEARVAIRNTRKDFNNLLRDAKKDKEISENFFNRLEDVLQKVTDKYIAKVDELSKKKEKDITTV